VRFMISRLTTVLASAAVAGLVLVHAQTPPVAQTPPMQQTPPVQPTPPPPPGTVITAEATLAPPLPPCPSVAPGLADVGPMLDRIAAIVNQSVGSETQSVSLAQKAATSGAADAPVTMGTTGNVESAPMKVKGGASNKVSIERDKLDEIRAEVAQIRAILKR
jgi:hypothetical protein